MRNLVIGDRRTASVGVSDGIVGWLRGIIAFGDKQTLRGWEQNNMLHA
jgi:hypothetical protein